MKEDFAFAYHPQKTGLAPAMGYLIRCEETLKKIYYVTSQRNTMSKNIVKQNIGIDISKDSFYVSFSQLRIDGSIRIAGSRTFKNTLKGMVKFIDWTEKKHH